MNPSSAFQDRTSSTTPRTSRESTMPEGYRVPLRRGSEYSDLLLRRLRTMLLEDPDQSAVIGVASCGRRQGVTTTAVNLAIRAADHLISPTLIVDANFNNRTVSKLYRCGGPGISECLTGEKTVEACVEKTKIKGMHVLGLGDRELARQLVLDPQCLNGFINEIREQYRLAVIDFPPMNKPSQADLLISYLDGVLLVTRYGTKKDQLAEFQADVQSAGSKVLGIVMTGGRSPLPKWLQRFF